jgi:hypothetical protein
VKSALGDYQEAVREFTFKLCDVYGLELNFNTVNIIEIQEINGKTFTTLATDFVILDPIKSRVYIKDLWDYLNGVDNYFVIKVKSGYATIPDDLKSLQLSICSLYYNTS